MSELMDKILINLISVPRGQCARVNTGAPVPLGCDAVVQVEDTKVIRRDQNQEEIEVSVPAVTSGNDIRPVGSDIQMSMKFQRIETC